MWSGSRWWGSRVTSDELQRAIRRTWWPLVLGVVAVVPAVVIALWLGSLVLIALGPFAALYAGIAGHFAARRRLIDRLSEATPICPHCRYDMSGSSAFCTECGATFGEGELRARWAAQLRGEPYPE